MPAFNFAFSPFLFSLQIRNLENHQERRVELKLELEEQAVEEPMGTLQQNGEGEPVTLFEVVKLGKSAMQVNFKCFYFTNKAI